MKDLLLRVDVDSFTCLTKGVPALLNIFRKYNIKATFFITFGREGNFFETLYFRRKRLIGSEKTKYHFPDNTLLPVSKRKEEIFKMLFLPKTLSNERSIIRSITNEGHDVQIHSYIHTLWKNPSYNEAKRDLDKAIRMYTNIYDKPPIGLSPPYHSISNEIMKVAIEKGFKYVSVPQVIYDKNLTGNKLIKNIPVTISKTSNFYPITEYYARKGLLGRELVDAVVNEFLLYENFQNNDLLSTYIHPRIEGVELLCEFEEICSILVQHFSMRMTFKDYFNLIESC